MRRAALLLPGLLASCSYPTNEAMFDPAVQSLGGAGFTVSASTPTVGATNVALGSAITLVFTDYPDPAALSPFGAVTLKSGSINRDITTTVDLVNKAVVIQPKAALDASTQFSVAVTTAMKSLAGDTVPGLVTISFTTGTTPGGGPTAPPKLSLATDIQPMITSDCATAGCHTTTTHAGGLDLTAGKTTAGVVGVMSTEVKLNLVSASDAANSYMLRKLLGTADTSGARMPNGAMWTTDKIQKVSDWINSGANP